MPYKIVLWHVLVWWQQLCPKSLWSIVSYCPDPFWVAAALALMALCWCCCRCCPVCFNYECCHWWGDHVTARYHHWYQHVIAFVLVRDMKKLLQEIISIPFCNFAIRNSRKKSIWEPNCAYEDWLLRQRRLQILEPLVGQMDQADTECQRAEAQQKLADSQNDPNNETCTLLFESWEVNISWILNVFWMTHSDIQRPWTEWTITTCLVYVKKSSSRISRFSNSAT